MRSSSARIAATIGLLCDSQSHRCSPELNCGGLGDRLDVDALETGRGELAGAAARDRAAGRAAEAGPSEGLRTSGRPLGQRPRRSRGTRSRAGRPYTTISTRPPGLTTRASSRMPCGMSGKSITPNCDPAMSKLSSVRSSAWPSITRVCTLSPSSRARRSSRSSIAGERSVASTWAPRRAAGMLSAPLPAATSRNRMPGRSPARRNPSLPSHICDGVFVRSYPAAMRSHAARVASCSAAAGPDAFPMSPLLVLARRPDRARARR